MERERCILEQIRERIASCPVIAAVKNEQDLAAALESECEVVFFLFGTILSIAGLVQRVKAAGKVALVHADLVEGLGNREIAVDALKALCVPDGIISTRPPLVRRARHLKLITVQRAFILDSMSISSLAGQLSVGKPDFIEVLPGIMPRVITEISERYATPVIAGGLIKYKDDVLAALRGARRRCPPHATPYGTCKMHSAPFCAAGCTAKKEAHNMKQYVIALDQGTTSSRCIIFDKGQNIVALEQREFSQHYPKPGWVEHDPMEIYSSQYSVLMEVLAQSGILPQDIAGIGITNQRETTIVWDKETGKPVYNAIVWQCRRTAALCEQLKKDAAFTEYVKENTGLLIDAYFSGTKIKWILDNVPGAREKAEAGRLFVRHGGHLAHLENDGRAHLCDGLYQRQPHHAVQHPNAVLGRGHLPPAGHPHGHATRGVRFQQGVRHGEYPGRGGAHRGHCGRPAGRAVRPDVLCPGRGKKHLWHGMLFADEHR